MEEVELFLHGLPVGSVFELLGSEENDITGALGWVLTRCPSFRASVVSELFPHTAGLRIESVHLQESSSFGGFTDVEMRGPEIHIILEAKRGWVLPGRDQLELYAPRFTKTGRRERLFAVLSECSPDYAGLHLPPSVCGAPVAHLGWRELARLAGRRGATHKESHLLEEFRIYLERIVAMQNQRSNMVFVVSLGAGKPELSEISWRDIVRKKGLYFHPVGKGWPKEPPNYIGFRYEGRLQSIHHIEDYEILEDMRQRIPEIHDGPWGEPHFLYNLGPAIRPGHEVKNGKIYPSARVWAMLDLLLTSSSVSEAIALTDARVGIAESDSQGEGS